MNDVVYNEIVATPGFETVFAVGTTYSLDIEAFLAITLSFARLGEFTDADLRTPLRLLEGVRKANERIALFCNRGGLIPPARKNALSPLLDKSVFEVNGDNALANFHPKIWVIKERSLENPAVKQIKLIVLSRNLTKDTSLDVAAALTAPIGGATDELRQKHAPLKELLLRLAGSAGPKAAKIRRLAADIDRLGRFELETPFTDYAFLPLYFGENLNPQIDFREELPAERIMVVSPFIDYETLEWLNACCPRKEKVLVTRLESLTPAIMQLFDREKAEVWTMSPVAEQNDVQPMNLHAKMYYSWRPRTGGIHLWLGSSNATHNGFYRNSEFLLRLTYKRGQNQFQAFKNEFCDESKQLCRQITTLPDEPDSPPDRSIQTDVRKWLIRPGNLTAEVVENDGAYDLVITVKRFRKLNAEVHIAPMQTPDKRVSLSAESRSGSVRILNKSDLSDFYILSVRPFDEELEPFRMVIKIPTKGIPADRDDSIFRSIIDTRDKFLSYIEMMISDRPQEVTAMLMQMQENEASGGSEQNALPTGFYESMLKIAATNPEKLSDIRELVAKLDDGVVPDSFRQMCDTFRKTIKRLK